MAHSKPTVAWEAFLGSGFAALLVASPGLTSTEHRPVNWLQTADGRFRDERGRPVLLRGANLGLYPDEPFEYQEADFERIAGWGFNAVRVPLRWESVEPQRAVYDEASLEEIDRYIEWARRKLLWGIVALFARSVDR